MSMFARQHDCPTCTCTRPLSEEEPIENLRVPFKSEESNVILNGYVKTLDEMVTILKDRVKEEHDARIKAENEAMTLLVETFDIGDLKRKNAKLQEKINEQDTDLISLTVALADDTETKRTLTFENEILRQTIELTVYGIYDIDAYIESCKEEYFRISDE